MKKHKITRALALALVLCMAMTQMVFADSLYRLDMTISSDNNADRSVAYTARYLTGGTSLAGQVVAGITARRDDGALKRAFGSPAMQNLMNDGITAYNAKAAGNATAWDDYITSMDASVRATGSGIKENLKDITKTFYDQGTGTYTLTFKNEVAGDAKVGTIYTVTIVITEDNYSGGGGTVTPVNKIEIKAGTNGSASVPSDSASKGQKVTVTVKPDEGYVPSRILVTDKDGNTVQETYEGNNSYSFIMPAGGVTVTPVFRKQTVSPAETGVAELLNVDDHTPFMIGDDKGNFRPSDPITRAEAAQIFYRLLKNQNAAITRSFDDVADNAWYAAAVNTLASMGILNGTGSTSYEPARAITRAEFTAICTRFAKTMAGSAAFTDVPESFWAYSNIAAAAEFGWIVGDGTGKFNPNADITRAEAAAIVNRMLGRLSDFDAIDAGAGKSFPDVSKSFWGFYDIAEATSGHDHSFDSEKLHEDWK